MPSGRERKRVAINLAEHFDRRAAIVCKHVALDGLPIQRAVRDEPTTPADSGWQFLCANRDPENPDEAKV